MMPNALYMNSARAENDDQGIKPKSLCKNISFEERFDRVGGGNMQIYMKGVQAQEVAREKTGVLRELADFQKTKW